jgi:hypothetical protein
MASPRSQGTEAPFEFQEDLSGRHFVFVGPFEAWPAFLGGSSPQQHLQQRGALVVEDLDLAAYLVVSDKRAKGRSEALRRAAKLAAKGGGPQVLDRRAFLNLVRPRVEGQSFAIVGALSPGAALDGPEVLVGSLGARIAAPEEDPDFWVVTERRAKGKTALANRLDELRERKTPLRVLDETAFLQLLAWSRSPQEPGFDVRSLVMELRALTDPKKVERAIQMLKRESYQLFSEATDHSLGGIVKSQTAPDAFYACWLDDQGRYGCYDPGLGACWGQSGEMCKHLMVLLVGLAAAQQLPAQRAYDWARAASRQKPAGDAEPSAELLLRYRGVEAGEQDWRPTETVPEDFYAL